MVGGGEATKRPSPGLQSTEALPQCRKLRHSPLKMALGGFAATVVLGYFILYSKKKPEASALDVAKATTGVSTPESTHRGK